MWILIPTLLNTTRLPVWVCWRNSSLKATIHFTIKDGAKGGESIPDRSYQVVRNMLKNEVNVSGAAYMGNETISTTAGKFDCVKISYLQRTKIVLKPLHCV